MKKYIAFLSLSCGLLLSTGCSAELVNAILSDDLFVEEKSSGGSVTSGSASGASDILGGGDTAPTPPDTPLVSTPENTPVYEDPVYETPISNPHGEPAGGYGALPEDEFLGDGADPAFEGSRGGTTTNDGTNVYFNEFLGYREAYFGPTDGYANILSGLSGNDAAGSRFGGPSDNVGVLVTHRDGTGYITVANLSNKRTFDVKRENGSLFTVPADVLGGRPFPSLFVKSIDSLTRFSFEHRTSPNPPKCSYYVADYKGTTSSGHYVAKLTGSGACYY